MKQILLIISFLNTYLLVQIANITTKLELEKITNIIYKISLKNINKSLCIVSNFKPSNYSQLTKKNEILIELHNIKFTLETIIED